MSAEPPETKRAIIQRSHTAAERLNVVLARLSDEQLLTPHALGDWSLRDVLSHIADHWFPEQMASYLESRDPDALSAWGTREPPGPEFDMASNDDRNAWQQQVRRQESVAEVRNRYERFLERMDRILVELPEVVFGQPFALTHPDFVGRVRPAREGEPGFPLWEWIRGAYWRHLEEHLDAFEAAAEQADER